jgi:vacuolar-type H+-ATPase subunit H
MADIEDFDEDFESKYDAMFGEKKKTGSFERDEITGRRSKRPQMSILNKSRVSKQELDELFL